MNLRTLPAVVRQAIPGASLPANYEAAKKALAECARVDECKEWSDKSTAIHTYAKQVGDTSLMDFAAKIRARAVRRLGELLQEQYPKKYGREVERSTGITASRAASARRLAAVPEGVFEAALCQKPVPGPRTIYCQHENDEMRKARSAEELAQIAVEEEELERQEEDKKERHTDQKLMRNVIYGMNEISGYGSPQELAQLICRTDSADEWSEFSDYVARVTNLVNPKRS